MRKVVWSMHKLFKKVSQSWYWRHICILIRMLYLLWAIVYWWRQCPSLVLALFTHILMIHCYYCITVFNSWLYWHDVSNSCFSPPRKVLFSKLFNQISEFFLLGSHLYLLNRSASEDMYGRHAFLNALVSQPSSVLIICLLLENTYMWTLPTIGFLSKVYIH
jgi:hypothetical protein